ncbi:MAG: HAMP domain-containing protein, partial [Starkeya sp.]|nr:HAMP domain-containing protein [Starkeya sp.]
TSRDLAAELGGSIGSVARQIETDARAAAARAAEAIVIGRGLLLAIAGLSLGVAVLVGWFYVRRSLVARLERLTLAAGAIAGGGAVELPAATTQGYFGADELDELARALVIFRQTRDELVQSAKLAALGQMAAGIGHELNQPLAAIRSHAHNGAVLLKRGRGDDAAESLARIEGLTVRMAQSIAHLKRFARRPEPALGAVDLETVVEGALSLFAQRIADERIEVLRAVPPGLRVRAEEVRLEQVLVNLIANAMDAVHDAATRRIEIRARREGEHVSIEIVDSGTGIGDAQRSDIFDPFFTTKPPGSGLGLGLSLSFNIIRDFGGRLLLKHSSPAGSTFAIELSEAA